MKVKQIFPKILHKKSTVLTLVLLLSASLFLAPDPKAQATTKPGYNGKIAFTTYRHGTAEIYSINSDGTGLTRLTNNAVSDSWARWSPDGVKLAFVSARDGNAEIYSMDADGANQTRLTNFSGVDGSPMWSMDGTKIAFIRNGAVWVMDANGANPYQVSSTGFPNSEPIWSPDDTKLTYYTRISANNYKIYVANSDGSNEINASNSTNSEFYPVWFDNGSKVIFYSYDGAASDIYSLSPDGSDRTNLTNSPENEYSSYLAVPADGSKFAMGRGDGSVHATIDLFDSAGNLYDTIPTEGTDLFYLYWMRNWSPDGKKLLAVGTDESWEDIYLYTIDTETDEILRLDDTFDANSTDQASWQPIPNTLPETNDDAASIPFNTPTLIDVLANDTDEEILNGANLSVTAQPSNGSAVIESGKIKYTPTSGFQGSDSLTYEICDSYPLGQLCSTGTVSLTVLAPIAPSVAVTNVNGEQYSPLTNHYTTSNLRPNFSGTATPGAEITVEIHSDPIILTTTADGNGNWSITPTFDLPSGQHMVYISATLYSLTTEITAFGLTIGELAATGENIWLIIAVPVLCIITGAGIVLNLVRSKTRLQAKNKAKKKTKSQKKKK